MFEKRRKLAETWDRVIKMYEKDQPDQFADLKKLWNNYQARKIEVVKYYESVISAQEVDVDAIPLPSADGGLGGMDIPLPPPSVVTPQVCLYVSHTIRIIRDALKKVQNLGVLS